MLKKAAFLFLFVFSLSAFPNFTEGTIKMNMKTAQGDGNIDLKISKEAVLSIVNMGLGQLRMEMEFLIKMDELSKIIQIDRGMKTYRVIETPESGAGEDPGQMEVKKLGTKKILGYDCNHISVTGKGFKSELWVSKDIDLYGTLKKIQALNKSSSNQQAIFKALEDKKLEGFPLKMWWQDNQGQKVDFSVTEIKKEKHPSSLFEIPKDFKKTENNPVMSPQNIQNLKQMFENLSPEQQEAIRKMMQGQN